MKVKWLQNGDQPIAWFAQHSFGPLCIGWHHGRFRAAVAINRWLGEKVARPKVVGFLERSTTQRLHFVCGPLSIEWMRDEQVANES